jgi:Mrp family chromosome partitioning ATPase
MIPLGAFLDQVDEIYGARVLHTFSHPFLTLSVTDSAFTALDEDQREGHFSNTIGIPVSEVRALCNRGFFRLDLRGDADTHQQSSLGASWIELFRSGFDSLARRTAVRDDPAKFLHFYGFKGGQARTTSLCATAFALARDGWRVLAVDFDAEAPSLDLVANASTNDANHTVLGLRMGEVVHPVSLGRTVRGGEFCVLPFRPRSTVFDLDAAALAFEFQVYAPAVDDIADKVAEIAIGYDLVLIDHRTGLGPIAPSIVKRLLGPVVVCARLDRQSEYAVRAVEALWSASAESRGVLLSFAPPEMSPEQYRKSSASEASALLQALANASGPGEDQEPREWSEFHDHWIVWPFDRSIATKGLTGVAPMELLSPAVHELRRLLNIDAHKQRKQKLSGAKDEGDLIVTQALRQLRSPDSPVMLIVGRKGTGKTRLVRQLSEEGIGEPLLVPSDFNTTHGGIRAGDLSLRNLASSARGREESFWYALITGALECVDTSDARLPEAITSAFGDPDLIGRFRKAAGALASKRTLLIDALESAFDHEQTFPFVQSLFRVLESIDATPDVTRKIQLRLFVRRDLLERGIQNREQFEDGRRLDLFWDVQTILNFVLTRIAALPWYSEVGRELVAQINRRNDELREGQVSSEDCEDLLLKLFPKSIQYKNIKTTTFLRTYFSDEGREPSFYPRVYLVFLQEIAKQHEKVSMKAGRLDGKVIVKAHDAASASFLQEVSQELSLAVPFSQTVISAILDGLVGKTTPFSPDALARSIAGAGTKTLNAGDVRRVFDVMKQLGVFEDHPKRLNTWRAGRLFKTGLKMRFAAGN